MEVPHTHISTFIGDHGQNIKRLSSSHRRLSEPRLIGRFFRHMKNSTKSSRKSTNELATRCTEARQAVDQAAAHNLQAL